MTKHRSVFVAGIFNVLHPGHIRLLKFAKECGDKLIVGVISDTLAGDGAHVAQDFRLEAVKMNALVDEVFLVTWFHPSVEIQRNDDTKFDHLSAFTNVDNKVIMQGDLLHVDFGISYLRLNSDIQEHAYVLKPNESDAPEYLKQGLKTANRLQDILTNNFKENKTGNEILKASLDQAMAENIVASIYTHPIGFNGHGAGPTIGMWDMQGGVPGSGDYPLYKNTCYSIELNASVFIKEWNKNVRFMLEQDGHFDGKTFYYIDGRQTKLHLIGKN